VKKKLKKKWRAKKEKTKKGAFTKKSHQSQAKLCGGRKRNLPFKRPKAIIFSERKKDQLKNFLDMGGDEFKKSMGKGKRRNFI